MFRRRINRYPTGRIDTSDELWFTDGLGNMVRMYGDDLPAEFERLARNVRGPIGNVRDRVGPFVYGFSYTFNPAESEPIFSEFGNIRPTRTGLQTESSRLAFVDLTEERDRYRVSVEVPGVDRGNIDLRMDDRSMVVDTTGDIKYHAEVRFLQPVNPDTAKATYKNGNITVDVEKMEKPAVEESKKVNVE